MTKIDIGRMTPTNVKLIINDLHRPFVPHTQAIVSPHKVFNLQGKQQTKYQVRKYSFLPTYFPA